MKKEKTKLKITEKTKKIIVLSLSIFIFILSVLASFSFWSNVGAINLIKNKNYPLNGQVINGTCGDEIGNHPVRYFFDIGKNSKKKVVFCLDPGYHGKDDWTYYSAELSFNDSGEASLDWGTHAVDVEGHTHTNKIGGYCKHTMTAAVISKIAVAAYYGDVLEGDQYRVAAQAIIWEYATGARTAAKDTSSITYSSCSASDFSNCRPNVYDGTSDDDRTTYYENLNAKANTDKVKKAYAKIVKKVNTYCTAHDCTNTSNPADDTIGNVTAEDPITKEFTYDSTDRIYKATIRKSDKDMTGYSCEVKSNNGDYKNYIKFDYDDDDNMIIYATDNPLRNKDEKSIYLECSGTDRGLIHSTIYAASEGETPAQYMIHADMGSSTKTLRINFKWPDYKIEFGKKYSDNIGDESARPVFIVQGYFNADCTDRELPSDLYDDENYLERWRIRCNNYKCTEFAIDEINSAGNVVHENVWEHATVIHVNRPIYYKIYEDSAGTTLYKKDDYVWKAGPAVLTGTAVSAEANTKHTFTQTAIISGFSKVEVDPISGTETPMQGAKFYLTSPFGGAGLHCGKKQNNLEPGATTYGYVIRKPGEEATDTGFIKNHLAFTATSATGTTTYYLNQTLNLFCNDHDNTYYNPAGDGSNAREYVHYHTNNGYDANNNNASIPDTDGDYQEGVNSYAHGLFMEIPSGRGAVTVYGNNVTQANGGTTVADNKYTVGGIVLKVPVIAGSGQALNTGGYQFQNKEGSDHDPVYVSGADGKVKIQGVTTVYPYRVFELSPADNMHTFANVNENGNYLGSFQPPAEADIKAVNYATELDFYKTDCDDVDEAYKAESTKVLQEANFQVTCNGSVLNVCEPDPVGHPGVYYNNDSGKCGTLETKTTLKINDEKKFKVYYVPWGSCSISETSGAPGYFRNTGSKTATITAGSSSKTTGGSVPSLSLIDQAIKIYFNKVDLEDCVKSGKCNAESNQANYYNATTDKATTDADTKIFDTAGFALYDVTEGKYVTLYKYDANTGTTNARYKLHVPEDLVSNQIATESEPTLTGNHGALGTGSIIHTLNGSLQIDRLIENHEYTIEEVKGTEPANFILPATHPEISYGTLSAPTVEDPSVCPDASAGSVTKVMENTATRIMIEKRDSKYWTLINDGSTTFELYKCDNENCTEKTQINLYQRAKIYNSTTQKYELAYQYSKLNEETSSTVKEMHTTARGDGDDENIGKIIVRYLPAGKYVFVETNSPKGYNLPASPNNETKVEVSGTTEVVAADQIANRPTQLLIKKYDQDGKKLTGAKFEIYKIPKDAYDKNLSSKNNVLLHAIDKDGNHSCIKDKKIVSCEGTKDDYVTPLAVQVVREGEYEYYYPYQQYTFTTCNTQAACDAVTAHLNSQSVKAQDFVYNPTKLELGEAIIQYLDYDYYYVVREVKAPDGVSANSAYGYSLDDDRAYSQAVYIPKTSDSVYDQLEVKMNNEFTKYEFLKYDEYGKTIDGAEFKLQKLDDNKKYQDVYVKAVTHEDSPTMVEDNEKVYIVTGIEGSNELSSSLADASNKNTIIETTNGKGKIFLLTEGQYRVLETKAPEGKELPIKQFNSASFFVTSSGKIMGSNIISNKAVTEKRIESLHNSSAEFIINIQTGQFVMKYGLIIVSIIGIIVLLFIGKKKMK